MNKTIINTKYMLKDIIAGDPSIDEREDYKQLTGEDINLALKTIINNPKLSEKEKAFYIANSWKIHYRGDNPPPTIEQFLTTEWLGPTAESLYDYVKDVLVSFWDPKNSYRNLILYPYISWGKSTASVISTLFITTHLMLMKNVNRFFGKSPTTIIIQALISFTKEKANELLLSPFIAILESTERFERCRTIDTLKKKNKEYGINKFFWSTASPIAALTFSNNINMKLISSVSQLLGVNIISAVFSELAFFMERGFSDDYIMRILNDTKKRIYSRFKTKNGLHYFARTIIDSSPNDLENAIDSYIVKEALKDKTNYIIKGAMWDWETEEYKDIKKKFYVFSGNANLPPKIVEEREKKNYNLDQVISVPYTQTLYSLFEDDIVKSLKDLAGVPAGTSSKLIYNKNKIEEMFISQLKNIYSYIVAPHTQNPKQLIWNLIKDELFVRIEEKSYQFWRYPSAPRFIAIDQSFSGDTTAITMVHRERLEDTEDHVFVSDFNLAIVPLKEKINLDAIKFFLHDLRRLGNIKIKLISFDKFESEQTVQYLDRNNFNVEKFSVDRITGPYFKTLNLLNLNRIKAGRNIFLKNNLKSLIMSKTKSGKAKVDHLLGKLINPKSTTDWDKSLLGYYAKDISDTLTAAICTCDRDSEGISNFVWKNFTNKKDSIKKQMLDDILDKYSLQI